MMCYFLQYGRTPIHLALRYGHVEVVEKLISSGVDVNVINKVSVNYLCDKVFDVYTYSEVNFNEGNFVIYFPIGSLCHQNTCSIEEV